MSHRPYKHIIELSNNERRELKALVSNGKQNGVLLTGRG